MEKRLKERLQKLMKMAFL